MSTEELRARLARHRADASTTATTPPRAAEDEQLDTISRAAAQARKVLAELEEGERTQPERLAQARAQAEDERIKALSAEPWPDVITGIPTVHFSGMSAPPSIVGKESFGIRLAFDLLGCRADEEQVAEKLQEYFRMVRDPGHMFLVCAAALDTIASHVVPMLLDTIEHQASDYDARVQLADAARHACAGRVSDFADDDGEGTP